MIMDISIRMEAYFLYSCGDEGGGFLFNEVVSFGESAGFVSLFHPRKIAF